MVIRTLNAPAGSGKTRACARDADRLARRGHKVLFVQPTRHLITKTIADELEPLAPSYPVTALHGGTVAPQASVTAAVVAHFKNAVRDRGEILFITHAGFLLTPYIERKADWVLIMDEVPQVDVFEELKLPETHDLITRHLTLMPDGAAYGRLVTVEDGLAAGEDAR
jgi:superfamily II DNA or RNA helicase